MSKKLLLPSLPQVLVRSAIDRALVEDLGQAGDLTSDATIPSSTMATAVLNSRQAGVLSGLDLAKAAFMSMGGDVKFKSLVEDGEEVTAGQDVALIEGAARQILGAERVALNFLCHLSGIATLTARYAAEIAHTNARICCTRKTTPGLRAFEKYAVKCGGGSNHRYGLSDAILIKDNHIAVAGGVKQAIERAQSFAGHLVKIEVEVDNLNQLKQALAASPDVVMLDNMDTDQLAKGVAMVNGQCKVEASGNVNLASVRAIAETGVDYISTSKITMSAGTLDLGLDIQIGQ